MDSRKTSAPPSLNIPGTRPSYGAKSPTFGQKVRNTTSQVLNDAAKYQERVKKLSDKTDQLIEKHRNAQQSNHTGATGVNSGRSVSLGAMSSPMNRHRVFCKENVPKINQIPPSPVIKKHQDFNNVSEPLTVSCENGKSLIDFKN